MCYCLALDEAMLKVSEKFLQLSWARDYWGFSVWIELDNRILQQSFLQSRIETEALHINISSICKYFPRFWYSLCGMYVRWDWFKRFTSCLERIQETFPAKIIRTKERKYSSRKRPDDFGWVEANIATLDDTSLSLNESVWPLGSQTDYQDFKETQNHIYLHLEGFLVPFQLNSNILLMPIAIAIINIAKDLFLVLFFCPLYFVLHYLRRNINLSAGHCPFISIISFKKLGWKSSSCEK